MIHVAHALVPPKPAIVEGMLTMELAKMIGITPDISSLMGRVED